MTIAHRLIVAFGLVVLILLGQSVMSFWAAVQSQDLVQGTVGQARARYELASALRAAGKAEELYLRRLSVQVDPAKVEREIASALKASADTDQALKSLLAMPLNATDTAALQSLPQTLQSTRGARDKVIDLGRQLQTDEVNQVFEDKLDPLIQQSQSAALAFAQQQKSAEEQSFAEIVALADQSRRITWITAVVGAVLAALAGLLLYRSVTTPLNATVRMADRVAAGDLTLQIEAQANHETGRMMNALGQMVRRMHEAIDTVVRSSASIHTASTEIAAGNLDLSNRTERQAAALQQATQSMEVIASAVRDNAEASQQAQTQAREASQQARSGGQQTEHIVQTMEAISASSTRMSEIIGVIDGIAFQTNILALNAAVEAARAGEQGRGFAVVASEVRGLAQRSAQAAKEIKALIQSNLQTVKAGAGQVTQARSTMASMVKASELAADLISRISEATAQQAQGVAQIHGVVSEIDEGLRQNAALVEEAAAAADSLRSQTEALDSVLGYFQLGAREQAVHQVDAGSKGHASPPSLAQHPLARLS
ncbi:methyl-accepting chemotaxis protein [Curvibacter gracilis]|uniref:methyl-accepting chemotaxis protein n=1 Tax=Curvibacter gracilis TaxID=230310 RepID=UPI000483F8E7|nr:methyl-accepting chemotaxis protein [Curvibacter gracilis]